MAMSRFIDVAVMGGVPTVLTYRADQDLTTGALVFAPLRGDIRPGFVVGHRDSPPEGTDERRCLTIETVAPFPPFFDDKMLELYTFTASYYGTPLGIVLQTAFPRLGRYRVGRTLAVSDASSLDPVIENIRHSRIKTVAGARRRFPELTDGQLGELAARGVLTLSRTVAFAEIATPPEQDPAASVAPPPVLTAEQSATLDAVTAGNGRFLLTGRTASGKTELLLAAARRVLDQGRSTLFMVPEIGLTPHIARRASALFAQSDIMLWHSGLSDRLRAWTMDSLRRRPLLVIGTRSSVFLPLFMPGLVIVDEEHDTSYKHEGGFPYNARDLALMRGKLLRHPVILSSATPSMESLYNATTGGLQRINLGTRFSPQAATIELVDTRDGRLLSGFFSHALIDGLKRNIEAGAQSMVFINRRGYVPHVYCPHCKNFILCKNCTVPLTWHKRKERYVCHRCGHAEPSTNACPLCGGYQLSFIGAGTERITELLEHRFPGIPVLKMDRETVERPGFMKKELPLMLDGTYRIIVGTQVVAKGIHLPYLTLVGILAGDQSLQMADFRAQERTFQLLTQVIGRAGREFPGRIVLQTGMPEAPAIRFALDEDADGFFESELAARRATAFPPVVRLLVVRIEARDDMAARELAGRIYDACTKRTRSGIEVFRPAPAPVSRERGYFRYQLFAKADSHGPLVKLIHHLKTTVRPAAHSRFVCDIDPYDLL